jgi:receptor-type tyrosine-protein phosphatase beta
MTTKSYFKFHDILFSLLYKRKANEGNAVGRVLGYTIIVTEDYTKNTEGDAFLPGWRDVQKFSVWPPYQVCHKDFPSV